MQKNQRNLGNNNENGENGEDIVFEDIFTNYRNSDSSFGEEESEYYLLNDEEFDIDRIEIGDEGMLAETEATIVYAGDDHMVDIHMTGNRREDDHAAGHHAAGQGDHLSNQNKQVTMKRRINRNNGNERYNEEQYSEEQYNEEEHLNNLRKKSKRQIITITWVFVLAFLGMACYIGFYSFAHKQEMVNNDFNGIQKILMAQNIRGSIYAGGGEVLAETQVAGDGTETRIYPYGNLFSHAVGYAVYGNTGIELQANYYLLQSSLPIGQRADNAAAGRKDQGDGIYTTLQVDLQEVASKALGVYKGAVIVTEPSTGRILAMVSKPDYDPAQIPSIWDEIINDDDSTILLNRAVQGLYPPGSTFKMITSLGYIRENGTDLSSYRYQCGGFFDNGEHRINCYHGAAHGTVDFTASFAESCNSSFANIGLGLDREEFAAVLDELLFGKELPLPFDYNKSRVDVNEDIDEELLMQITIGQGTTLITPMHLNMITSAIANDGVLMEPQLIDAVKSDAGNIVRTIEPTRFGTLMSTEEAAVLQQLMESVVEEGTASRLRDAAYTAAGKTGSAEFGDIKGESHAWFTGYAPADNPEI
ncbi:MAG: hypothetical protein LBV33_02245, partial [Lachnospiraceae bacterium]|nr:hypothetical protein [Lachnospiraceae bacterium]